MPVNDSRLARTAGAKEIAKIADPAGAALLPRGAAQFARAVEATRAEGRDAVVAGAARAADEAAEFACAAQADFPAVAAIARAALLVGVAALLADAIEAPFAEAATAGIAGARSVGVADLPGLAAGSSFLAGIALAELGDAPCTVRTGAALDRLLAVVLDASTPAAAGRGV